MSHLLLAARGGLAMLRSFPVSDPFRPLPDRSSFLEVPPASTALRLDKEARAREHRLPRRTETFHPSASWEPSHRLPARGTFLWDRSRLSGTDRPTSLSCRWHSSARAACRE